MEKTVIILLSDKRSGSTMFQREICKHPDIQTVSYSPHTYLETHHWLKGAVMLGVSPDLFSGGKVYPGYGSKNNARIYMEDCILKNVPDFSVPKDDRDLVFQGWEALCHRFAQPVFFEKSPQFLAHWGCLELILEWIKQTQFRVKIIGLVRNPLSVLYSAQELFNTPPEKRQYGWLAIHRNLLRLQESLSSEQFMICRYEDIIDQPLSTFAKITNFIGVQDNDSVGGSVHAESIDKWSIDPYFTIQLDDSVKEMAKKLGYKDEELFNPIKPLPSMTYRVSRKIKGWWKQSLARFRYRVYIPAKLKFTKNN